MQETWVWFLVLEDALGEEMANDSDIFTWKVPWTEEPGGLQPTGLQRVGDNWATEHAHITYRYIIQCISWVNCIYIYFCVYMYIWASLVCICIYGLPWWLRRWKTGLQCRRSGLSLWVGKILWRREWLLTSVFLSTESQRQRSLAGYSPWGHKELDMTEQLNTYAHTHICICVYIYVYIHIFHVEALWG